MIPSAGASIDFSHLSTRLCPVACECVVAPEGRDVKASTFRMSNYGGNTTESSKVSWNHRYFPLWVVQNVFFLMPEALSFRILPSYQCLKPNSVLLFLSLKQHLFLFTVCLNPQFFQHEMNSYYFPNPIHKYPWEASPSWEEQKVSSRCGTKEKSCCWLRFYHLKVLCH